MDDKLKLYLSAIKKEANDMLKPETNKVLLAKNILYYTNKIEKLIEGVI